MRLFGLNNSIINYRSQVSNSGWRPDRWIRLALIGLLCPNYAFAAFETSGSTSPTCQSITAHHEQACVVPSQSVGISVYERSKDGTMKPSFNINGKLPSGYAWIRDGAGDILGASKKQVEMFSIGDKTYIPYIEANQIEGFGDIDHLPPGVVPVYEIVNEEWKITWGFMGNEPPDDFIWMRSSHNNRNGIAHNISHDLEYGGKKYISYYNKSRKRVALMEQNNLPRDMIEAVEVPPCYSYVEVAVAKKKIPNESRISVDEPYEVDDRSMAENYFLYQQSQGNLTQSYQAFIKKLSNQEWYDTHLNGWCKYGVDYLTSHEFSDQLSLEEKEALKVPLNELALIPHYGHRLIWQTMRYYSVYNDYTKRILTDQISKISNRYQNNPLDYLKDFIAPPDLMYKMGYPQKDMDEYVMERIDIISKSNDQILIYEEIKKILVFTNERQTYYIDFDEGGWYDVANKVMEIVPSLWGYLNAEKIRKSQNIINIMKKILIYEETHPIPGNMFEFRPSNEGFDRLIKWVKNEIGQIKEYINKKSDTFNFKNLIEYVFNEIFELNSTEIENLIMADYDNLFKERISQYLFIECVDELVKIIDFQAIITKSDKLKTTKILDIKMHSEFMKELLLKGFEQREIDFDFSNIVRIAELKDREEFALTVMNSLDVNDEDKVHDVMNQLLLDTNNQAIQHTNKVGLYILNRFPKYLAYIYVETNKKQKITQLYNEIIDKLFYVIDTEVVNMDQLMVPSGTTDTHWRDLVKDMFWIQKEFTDFRQAVLLEVSNGSGVTNVKRMLNEGRSKIIRIKRYIESKLKHETFISEKFEQKLNELERQVLSNFTTKDLQESRQFSQYELLRYMTNQFNYINSENGKDKELQIKSLLMDRGNLLNGKQMTGANLRKYSNMVRRTVKYFPKLWWLFEPSLFTGEDKSFYETMKLFDRFSHRPFEGLVELIDNKERMNGAQKKDWGKLISNEMELIFGVIDGRKDKHGTSDRKIKTDGTTKDTSLNRLDDMCFIVNHYADLKEFTDIKAVFLRHFIDVKHQIKRILGSEYAKQFKLDGKGLSKSLESMEKDFNDNQFFYTLTCIASLNFILLLVIFIELNLGFKKAEKLISEYDKFIQSFKHDDKDDVMPKLIGLETNAIERELFKFLDKYNNIRRVYMQMYIIVKRNNSGKKFEQINLMIKAFEHLLYERYKDEYEKDKEMVNDPILYDRLEDPVINFAGKTYSKKVWKKCAKSKLEPLTNERLKIKRYVSNNAMQRLLDNEG